MVEGNLELVGDVDVQALPSGIGVQLVNDPQGLTSVDRYVRTGLILFDRQGRLDSLNYAIQSDSALGRLLKLTGPFIPPLLPSSQYRIRSQFGVAVYDLQAFRNHPGNTEGDAGFVVPNLSSPTAYDSDERDEEDWLSQNAAVLMVNRLNGTLVKGE